MQEHIAKLFFISVLGVKMGNEELLVKNSEITDNIMNCLKFAVETTKSLGGVKEIGIKGYEFTLKEMTTEANRLADEGYLSRQMIFANSADAPYCNLAGEQGNKNIQGMFFAVTQKGLDLYDGRQPK